MNLQPPAKELEEVARGIFGKPPGPVKSHCLMLTEESAEPFLNDPDASPELELYTDLARLGVPILFGDACDISKLSRDQFSHLQQYMHSMGVSLVIKCNSDGVDPWDLTEAGGVVSCLRISVKYI